MDLHVLNWNRSSGVGAALGPQMSIGGRIVNTDLASGADIGTDVNTFPGKIYEMLAFNTGHERRRLSGMIFKSKKLVV